MTPPKSLMPISDFRPTTNGSAPKPTAYGRCGGRAHAHRLPRATVGRRGLIAEGVTVLAGAAPEGRPSSWLALNIAVAVASGGKALGSIDCTPGDVLYLALEDNGRRLQSRLRAVLGPDPRTRAAPPGHRLRVAHAWRRRPDHRLASNGTPTVGSSSSTCSHRVRGRVPPKTTATTADYLAVSILKRIADEHEVAILVLHHTRKAMADDFIDSVSGTQGIAGAADAVVLLTRSRTVCGAMIKITGRDVEEAEHAVDFDAPTGHLEAARRACQRLRGQRAAPPDPPRRPRQPGHRPQADRRSHRHHPRRGEAPRSASARRRATRHRRRRALLRALQHPSPHSLCSPCHRGR